MADLIQFRRDTAVNWTSSNPTLAQGELGYETDTETFKIGDGSTAWSSLLYFSGGGGGGSWGTITGTLSAQTDLQTALNAKQPLDSDLTTIAGLSATTDNFLQAKASAWASRTITQVKTDLGLSGTNSGDQSSIVGITGTKAQFDTAVTDGNFLYVGDAPTTHTHVIADVTGLQAALDAKSDLGKTIALKFALY